MVGGKKIKKTIFACFKLILIGAFVILASYGFTLLLINRETIKTVFEKEKFVIVDKQIESKRLIIQRVLDTTYFSEFSSEKYVSDTYKSWDAFYYNHKIGDTLYYDKIKIDRFFQAKNGINK